MASWNCKGKLNHFLQPEASYGDIRFRKAGRTTSVQSFHHQLHQGMEEEEEEEEGEEERDGFIYENYQNSRMHAALVTLLKRCAAQRALFEGNRIHADIISSGVFTNNMFIGNSLVNMYAKCGALSDAQDVFNELLTRNVVSWNALMAGYTQHGHGEKALSCFERMQGEGFIPTAVTLTCILKACGSIGAAIKGQELHAVVAGHVLLDKNIVVGNTLMDMYFKCNALATAQGVFDRLLVHNVVSWNVLITGYCHHGQVEEAYKCLEKMQEEGLHPNAVTLLCMLKACGSIGAFETGTKIHAQVVRQGLLGIDIAHGNALVDMYAKCGALAKAQQIFAELPVHDKVSWTVLIVGYARHGHGQEALKLFEWMKWEGLSSDVVPFACFHDVALVNLLKACAKHKDLSKGCKIHAYIPTRGSLGKSFLIGNALVNMYGKCGALAKAQLVFDELPVRNIATWNTLIAGYCQQGYGKEALERFEQMQGEGFSPNSVTFLCVLRACTGAIERGNAIHVEIVRLGLLENGSTLGNALVDMHAKCGALAKAQQVFDDLVVQDVISWTALITGYVQHGCSEEALNCYERMQYEGLSPNAVTFTCILKACGSMGATEKGKAIHAEIARKALLGQGTKLGNALVDMYAKCGALGKAQAAFDELPVRNVVSWNVLIAGYCQHGQGEKALVAFEMMQQEGLSPDVVTLACILKACGSIGATKRGQVYFETVSINYGIVPTAEHQTCLVDLFGLAGHFDKAMSIMKKMPSFDYLQAWYTLLGSCQKWGNVRLGRFAFEQAMQLDRNSPIAYVCMSKIYAASGLQEDAHQIKVMKTESEAWVEPGATHRQSIHPSGSVSNWFEGFNAR